MMRSEGWTESARGVHGASSERAGKENVHGDGEADGEAGDFVECAFGVGSGGEDDPDEKKRSRCLESHPVHAREIGREVGCAKPRGTPNGFRQNGNDQVGGCGCAKELSDPVEQGLHGADPLRYPETDGDGRVQVAAGNVTNRGDHDGDGEPVGGGDGKQSHAALTGGAKVLIGADGSDADENQSECADELGE